MITRKKLRRRRAMRWPWLVTLGSILGLPLIAYFVGPRLLPDGSAVAHIKSKGGWVQRHSLTPGLSAAMDAPVFTMGDVWDVELYSSAFTDDDMYHLAHLTEVEILNLYNTQLGDAGLEHIANLRKLRSLLLVNTEITDAGLAHLAGLHRLEDLDLSETVITGSGLEHLINLKFLRCLYIRNTRVTLEEVQHFRRMQPQCLIQWKGDLR